MDAQSDGEVIGTGSTNALRPDFLALMRSSLWQGTWTLAHSSYFRLLRSSVGREGRGNGKPFMFAKCTEREQALIVWVGFGWISFRKRSCVGFRQRLPSFTGRNRHCREKWSLELLSPLISFSSRETKQVAITCTPRSNETAVETRLMLSSSNSTGHSQTHPFLNSGKQRYNSVRATRLFIRRLDIWERYQGPSETFGGLQCADYFYWDLLK